MSHNNYHQSKNDTIKHIQNVQVKIASCINALKERAFTHDRSKLEEPEIEYFDRYQHKLKLSSFGSKQYDNTLEAMRPALDHHYSINRHHPEYFKKWVCDTCFKEYEKEPESSCESCGNDLYSQEADINQMNLIDVMEMFCDWIAATERHADGNIYTSLVKLKSRYKLNDQLIDILKNTALDIFNKKPAKRPEYVENDE